MDPSEAPLHYGALEIITVIGQAVRKLEKNALEEDLVLKSLSRNGFLEFRPVDPGTKEMKLVRTAGQSWRKKLPNPESSHHLQNRWCSMRHAYVDLKTGVPQTTPAVRRGFPRGVAVCSCACRSYSGGTSC